MKENDVNGLICRQILWFCVSAWDDIAGLYKYELEFGWNECVIIVIVKAKWMHANVSGQNARLIIWFLRILLQQTFYQEQSIWELQLIIK